MSHPSRSQLRDYLKTGDRPVEDSEWIEDHINDCNKCQQQLDDLSSFAADHDETNTVAFGDSDCAPQFDSRYQLIDQIGRGGMADVFRCRDTTLDRSVAIKVIRSELSHDQDALQRFDRESRICARLQHPGIVPVHDIGRVEDGRPFIAMKHVEGETLASLLQNPDREQSAVGRVAVFVKICEAMAYVHESGVIHRDLKPQNIQVGKFGEVQIMDWGIAKAFYYSVDSAANDHVSAEAKRGDLETAAIGTPGYMSPEQSYSPQSAVDPRSDVFALGVIFAEMLLSHRCFDCSIYESETQHSSWADELVARLVANAVEPELIRLIADCISSNPQRRPDDAGEIAVRTKAFLSSQAERTRQAEVRAASALAKSEADRKRRNQVVALSAMLLAAVVSAAALYSRDVVQRNRKQILQVANVDAFLSQRVSVSSASLGSLDDALDLRNETLKLASQSVSRSRGTQLNERIKSLDQFISDRQRYLDTVASAERLLASVDSARAVYRLNCNGASGETDVACLAAVPMFDTAFADFGFEPDNVDQVRSLLAAVPRSLKKQVDAAVNEWILLTHMSGQSGRAARMRSVLVIPETQVDQIWRCYDQSSWRDLNALSVSAPVLNDPFLTRLCYELKREQNAQSPRTHAGLRKAWMKHPEDFHLNWELGRHWLANGEKAAIENEKANHTLYSMWALTFFVRCNLAFNDHEGSVDQASEIMKRLGQPQAAEQMLEEWRSQIAATEDAS